MRCCHPEIPDQHRRPYEEEVNSSTINDEQWTTTDRSATETDTTEIYGSTLPTDPCTTEQIETTTSDFTFDNSVTELPFTTTIVPEDIHIINLKKRYPKMENNVALIYPTDVNLGLPKKSVFTPRKIGYQTDANVVLIYPQVGDGNTEDIIANENVLLEMSTPLTTTSPSVPTGRTRRRKLLRRRKILRNPSTTSVHLVQSVTKPNLSTIRKFTTPEPDQVIDDLQANDSNIIGFIAPIETPEINSISSTTAAGPALNEEIMEVMKKRLIVLLKNRKSSIPQSSMKTKSSGTIIPSASSSTSRKTSHNFDTSSRINFLRQGSKIIAQNSAQNEQKNIVLNIDENENFSTTTESQVEVTKTELPEKPIDTLERLNKLIAAGDNNMILDDKEKGLNKPYRGKKRYEKPVDNDTIRLLAQDYRTFKKRTRIVSKPIKNLPPNQVLNDGRKAKIFQRSMSKTFMNVMSKAPETFVYNFKPPRVIEDGFLPMVF